MLLGGSLGKAGFSQGRHLEQALVTRSSALSLSMVSLLSSLFGEECARWISEHSPGQNLVCQPVSVSGRNEAFLRAAISEPLVLCYYCSVSYLWQLLTVEVFLHIRFLLLGQQSLTLFFFFLISCGRKPIILIQILCLRIYNFPVVSRCKWVRNKASVSCIGTNLAFFLIVWTLKQCISL